MRTTAATLRLVESARPLLRANRHHVNGHPRRANHGFHATQPEPVQRTSRTTPKWQQRLAALT